MLRVYHCPAAIWDLFLTDPDLGREKVVEWAAELDTEVGDASGSLASNGRVPSNGVSGIGRTVRGLLGEGIAGTITAPDRAFITSMG